jgi:hypothetical protein
MQGGLDALRVDGFVIFVSRLKVQSSNRAVKNVAVSKIAQTRE